MGTTRQRASRHMTRRRPAPSSAPAPDWLARHAWLKPALFGIFLLFVALHYADRINLTNSDLGRHLKTGELVLRLSDGLLSRNFYSFTQPHEHVINHHWGAGVIFYLLWTWTGFRGLSLWYILLLLAGFVLFFRVAARLSDFTCALFLSLLALPLICDRREIRPEGFSSLFLGLYVSLLYGWKARTIPFRVLLWTLPPLQIVWTNVHIFFFMGPMLVGAFLLDAWVGERDPTAVRQMGLLGALCAAATLINPAGLEGALVALTIFRQYGYLPAENCSVVFMQRHFPDALVYPHFEALFALSLVTYVLVCRKHNVRRYVLSMALFAFFSILAWNAIRGLAVWALVSLPLTAFNLSTFVQRFPVDRRRMISNAALIVAAGLLLWGALFDDSYLSPYRRLKYYVPPQDRARVSNGFLYLLAHPGVWTGLMPGVDGSAEFVKRVGIQGPMFNNYDIGGYLIFHFFPQLPVFVDNRPEAYTTRFFKDIYIPMQERDEIWNAMEERYGFNVIYFNRYDQTSWGQPFLARRLHDPRWTPVFVDSYTLILLKRNAKNQPLIERFALPSSMFVITGPA
jgi:hypothetical protein